MFLALERVALEYHNIKTYQPRLLLDLPVVVVALVSLLHSSTVLTARHTEREPSFIHRLRPQIASSISALADYEIDPSLTEDDAIESN